MAGGLLGADFDDPKTQGLLGMALSMLANSGPSPVRQTFGSIVGRAGMEGMAAGNRARVLQQRDEELRRRNALVDAQLRKMQASEAEEAAARQAVVEEARRLSTPQYPPGTSVVQLDPAKQPQNVTPTLPKFDPLEAISRGVPLSAVATMRGLQPKPGEGFTLGRGEARYDESGRLIATAPKSDERSQEEKLGALIYGEGTPQYMDYLRRLAEKKASHAPGTSVSFNTGEKGFKHSIDLANSFKAEPIYKAHQEVTSAYGQIMAGLSNPSGAGDLAAATKFMKLLDPTSVVRESELMMAMSTSGLLDRMVNYADQIITGKKLTPTQRNEFKNMTEKLFNESRNLYNQKRSQYVEIAKRYKLDDAVIPSESIPRIKLKIDWRSASDEEVLQAIKGEQP